jgi:hypothetical protein
MYENKSSRMRVFSDIKNSDLNFLVLCKQLIADSLSGAFPFTLNEIVEYLLWEFELFV